MKILIICPFYSPNIGGVEVHLDDLVSHLRKNGNKVYVNTYQPLTTNSRGKFHEKVENLEIYRLPWFGRNLFPKLEKNPILEYLYVAPALFLFSFLFCLRHKKDIDLISAHGFISALISKGITSILKIPNVVTVHTIYDLQTRPLLSKIVALTLAGSSKILTIANTSKTELVAAGVPSSKITVFTYWVDQNRFKPLDKLHCKEILNWQNKFVVLFVGRLIEAKGIRILVESARLLEEGIFLAFVTTGSHSDFLKMSKEERQNMIYVGPVRYSRLHLYYNAADILAVPSVFEGFARVNVEAMSCGTPVIASNVGCLPEVFGSNSDTLIKPTPEEFARMINSYFNKPSELAEISRKYLDYALERFSENNAKIVEDTFYDAIRESRQRS